MRPANMAHALDAGSASVLFDQERVVPEPHRWLWEHSLPRR
jgi:hypothetical protein